MRNSHGDGAGLRPGLGVAAAALMLLPFAAGPAFDADLNVLVINWCDKPEALNVTLGCMPGN